MFPRSTNCRRRNLSLMLAMTFVAVGVLLGCAGSDRDGESTISVAADAEGECSGSVEQGFALVDAASDGETDPGEGGPATVACRSDEQSWTEVEPYIVVGAKILVGTAQVVGMMAELTLFAIQTVSLVAMIVPH
jgi:hypothetical protein